MDHIKQPPASNEPMVIKAPETERLLEHHLVKSNSNAQDMHRTMEHTLAKSVEHDARRTAESDVAVEQRAKMHDAIQEGSRGVKEAIGSLGKPMDAAHFLANFMEAIRGEKGDKGDEGEVGYTPQKGKDYLTDDEVDGFLKSVTPVKGEHYFTEQEAADFKKDVTPQKGVDYFDGVNGNNGKDAEPVDYPKIFDYITERVAEMPRAKDGKAGRDGKSVTVAEIIEALKKGPKELRLRYDDLEGAPQFPRLAGTGYLREISDVDTTGLRDGQVLVWSAALNKWQAGTASGGVTPEVADLSALLDGATKSFTIPANTKIISVTGSNAPFVFRPTTDFTGSGTTTLAFTADVDAPSALPQGGSLLVTYY